MEDSPANTLAGGMFTLKSCLAFEAAGSKEGLPKLLVDLILLTAS